MPQKITLSTVPYFVQGNTFTGSSTPEQFVADPFADIFNYRASCKNEGGVSCLYVEYYIGCKCYALTDSEKISSADFDMTGEGIKEAEAFLQKKFEEYVGSLSG
jgi:hypothetical protein